MKSTAAFLTPAGLCILAAVALLIGLGLASIYVTDTHYASGHDGPANALKQLLSVGLSIAAGAVVLRIGHQRIAPYSYWLLGLAVASLAPLVVARITHSEFGGLIPQRNGAYRWIRLPGMQFQPAETVKLAFVIALAWYLRYRSNYRTLRGLLVPLFLAGVPLSMILLQPDLGMALLLIPVLFTMLLAAGARLRHIGLALLLGLAAAPLAWGHIHNYQRLRIVAVLLQSESLRQAVIADPEEYSFLATRRQAIEWAASSGYQLVQSKNALGSGGLIGNGWGKGIYVENPILPDRHNDFVFAVVGHQWGFAGCVLVLACYGIIVFAGMAIASATVDPFGRLLAVGVVTLLGVQALINIGMTIGLMPITGVTLPFVSYGGSSLLANMAAVALLISVSRRRPYLLAMRPFEYNRRDHRPHPTERESTIPAGVKSG